MTTMTPHPIAAYQASVERHLADLPDHVRADLRARLAEAAAALAPGESPDLRLGSAEHCATRLRDTVELRRAGLAARLYRGEWTGRAAAIAATLRPGWWALHGLITAVLIAAGAWCVFLAIAYFTGLAR
ncbi:hypothetical protein [Glycomyces harbinensis]|uniref:Uncharacterized protein n=1 Tax=Glycomyces harbinensis TaxID=58114 RepID=A0A1G6T038_9ACTN|nr:hypothetical protein [Glycomyces harbinensis]SDD22383.1 hypothetical protein SAMN05216270_102401 [Glycomyces harbinensis]